MLMQATSYKIQASSAIQSSNKSTFLGGKFVFLCLTLWEDQVQMEIVAMSQKILNEKLTNKTNLKTRVKGLCCSLATNGISVYSRRTILHPSNLLHPL